MSHNFQDDTRPECAATPKSERITPRALATKSTPATKKHGCDLPYATTTKTFHEVRYDLGKEMDGRWLGAIPVNDFLDKCVPAAKESLPQLPDDPFQNVPSDGVESIRYNHFIAAIESWIPHLQAVNTSATEDTVNKVNLKTDISIYNRAEGVANPTKTDFSRMELWMEFKVNKDDAAFKDPRDDEERRSAIETGSFTPDTEKGNDARGQLAHYAGALHSQQFRHFSFSIIVQGDEARFLRWDPSGTVVTAGFNYRTSPELMADFLWRFDHLSLEQRGHDVSVQPANLALEADARVRTKLGMQDKVTPLYRYKVPGALAGIGYAYGPRPPTQNRTLVSRCTRSLPVVWIPNVDAISCPESDSDESDTANQDPSKKSPWSEERTIYMKDTWRFLSDLPDVEVIPEHEIYEMLHRHGTPNIPELVVGGDVEGGMTQTQELVSAEWVCTKPRISPYQHYRLVHGIIGRPLFKFECTKQLVIAVLHAVQAHSHAFNCAKILHRDISAGNIILTDEGRGLLIDWELAKKVDERGSRRPDRTGTWQFMSANLLQNPGKMHTFTDDLESFLHVLGWTTLRYVPAIDSYNALRRSKDMAVFDELDREEGHSDEGGHLKSLLLSSGKYPSSTFRPKHETPLLDLLRQLSSPFKSLYALEPPTAEDRKKLEAQQSDYDDHLEALSWDIRRYDRDIEHLRSSAWLASTIEKALDEKAWPTNDKANEKLRIGFPRATARQAEKRTSQLQYTQNLWELSKALRSSSKRRAANPTPEPSAKRRRGTPAASGTGI